MMAGRWEQEHKKGLVSGKRPCPCDSLQEWPHSWIVGAGCGTVDSGGRGDGRMPATGGVVCCCSSGEPPVRVADRDCTRYLAAARAEAFCT